MGLGDRAARRSSQLLDRHELPRRRAARGTCLGPWIDDAVVFSTSPESRKGRNLAHDPRVVVHLESGDEVVIVEGEVETIGLDDRIAGAYEAKYDSGNPEPLWYRVPPRIVYAWLETAYPRSVTRFSFD
jgi:hypothetical protein